MRILNIFSVVALLVVLGGCGSSGSDSNKRGGVEAVVPATIPKGTGVRLMLLEPLESGVTPEGKEAVLMVAEDVMVGGSVVIPKGSLAKGVVSWSRRADSMSALSNRPARLAIKLVSIAAPGGVEVPIEPVESDDGAYQFTRGNTGRTEVSSRLEELWKTEEGQKMLTQVQELIEKGGDLDSPESAKLLTDAIEKLELPRASQLLREGKIGEVQGLLGKIRRGEGLAELAAKNLTGLGAVMEFASLAKDVSGKVGGMIRGANIKAHVGTEVEGRVR